MIVFLTITELPAHKMIKIVGEKLSAFQLKIVKKISSASKNSTTCLLVVMMICSAGKNIITDPTVEEETWIAWNNIFLFQIQNHKKMKYNFIKGGFNIQTARWTMGSVGKIGVMLKIESVGRYIGVWLMNIIRPKVISLSALAKWCNTEETLCLKCTNSIVNFIWKEQGPCNENF